MKPGIRMPLFFMHCGQRPLNNCHPAGAGRLRLLLMSMMDNNMTNINPARPSLGRKATANIFAISGSLRSGSSNDNILKFVGTQLPPDVNYFIYDRLAEIPPFDPGNDHEHVDENVAELRSFIKNADAIIICTPEYAYGVPGQLKNALDWMVSSGSFVDKPVSLITASLGGEACHAAMQLILGAINATVIPDATLLIQFIRSKMGVDGKIADEGTREEVKKTVAGLLKAID
jgi:chromate reductase